MYNNKPIISNFSTDYGSEIYITYESPPGLSFEESVILLFNTYDSVSKENSLTPETEIMTRFHLSDIANQAKLFREYLNTKRETSYASIVGTPPVFGKVAIESYHIKSKNTIVKTKPDDGVLCVKHNKYSTIWLSGKPSNKGNSEFQSNEILDKFSRKLIYYNATIQDNLIRTWFYVRDIDNNYAGFVKSRREFFKTIGLTNDTHFVASTGIEGCCENVSDLVYMNSLSITGLQKGQIEYMSVPDYMCPTYFYNVTFERATKVNYGDRTHYYISGTASIDKEGNVLHIGNVEKQAERTLENINALLSAYGADFSDMKVMLVYLRDLSDLVRVSQFLKQKLPENLPYIIVRGAVCRPTWLIEMEGIAISSKKNNSFFPFC